MTIGGSVLYYDIQNIIYTYFVTGIDIIQCFVKAISYTIELVTKEPRIHEEMTHIEYDFNQYSEEKLENIVKTKLIKFSNSAYYKKRIKSLNMIEIEEKIQKSIISRYNWYRLLMQAEFLLGFYESSDFTTFDSVNFDWTFIYVLLAKSTETLIANYIEIKMKDLVEIESKDTSINRFGKKYIFDVNHLNWRGDLTIRDYQEIINRYIVPFSNSSNSSGLLNERIRSLFREDRNKLLHDEILLGFNQLKKYHFENIYHLVYLIISEL